MGGGIPIDLEDQLPLLDKKSEKQSESPGIPPQPKLCNGWAASIVILGFVCLERMAYFGISADLVEYLGTVLNGSNASNAANVSIFAGTSYLIPVFGALLADTYFGNYRMILISVVVFLLGSVMMTASAFTTAKPFLCETNPCNSASKAQNFIFFIGLYLVAIGSGGIKAPVLPFGADQFDGKTAEDKQRKSTFFSLFYAFQTFGTLVSGTLIVWLQENVGWALGYGISTLCIAIALGCFVLGTPLYSLQNPQGSPLKIFLQVLVASFRNRSLPVPTDTNLFYEKCEEKENNDGQQSLTDTDSCRFADKLVIPSHLRDDENSWTECAGSKEELMVLVHLMPVWATGLIYSAAYRQLGTTFIQQGHAMNTKIMSFSIPPAALASFETICVIVWIIVLNRCIMPLTKRWLGKEVGLTQLQRMGMGKFLMIVTMITAAYLERRRLDSAREGEMLTIAWQLPQYFIFAGSEAFYYIAQYEFFYSQAPESMKCMCTAFSLLTISFGSYLSSLLVALVAFATTSQGSPGWIPDDLNNGRLDYFFLVLAGLCMFNSICFTACSRKYTPKGVI